MRRKVSYIADVAVFMPRMLSSYVGVRLSHTMPVNRCAYPDIRQKFPLSPCSHALRTVGVQIVRDSDGDCIALDNP